MKYEINGLEQGKTIKSVQVVDCAKTTKESSKVFSAKVIMVDYLDGTQDIFEFNEEILKRIQTKVDAQAQMFVNREKGKFPLWAEVNGVLSLSALLVAISAILVDKMLIVGIVSTLVSAFCVDNAARISRKNKSVKKHKIYVDKIMGKLDEYNEILKKENQFNKTPNKELINIINIDKKSVKELEHIGNKIERYNEIEGKSPKTKSL